MRESIKLFLPNREAKYFCQQDWTSISQNSLSGKSVGLRQGHAGNRGPGDCEPW
jgi:hypothetical protein